ncbi:VpaChn25_0724 family phage protein [Salinisphaera hydrothermalis]|uniref:VpaChn25_0724 family phage protein n=1 Tax=Salinisphaera hydrothermalis TaxID=563188 RepID=UPI0033406FF0
MAMSYAERVAADRRLVICRILNEAPGYKANSSILKGMLDEIGHSVSRERVKADLDWMAEMGVVEIEELAIPGLHIVTLTQRGQDVATGSAQITGIARPSPSR